MCGASSFRRMGICSFAAVLLSVVPQAKADPFLVTLEKPGVEQSSLFLDPAAFGATGVFQDNFNADTPGLHNSLMFGGSPNVGTYGKSWIQGADQWGGAGGVGNYFNINNRYPGAPSSTTLTLNQPERYFGLWWSAGDPNNEMDFYSGNTLIEKFTTANLLNFINSQPASLRHQYFGNPNSQFKGKNAGEPYAFVNFFADPNNKNVTFNKVVFINHGNTTGFESDNHTIAATYSSTTPVPEPSTVAMMGIGGVALFGMLAIRARRRASA